MRGTVRETGSSGQYLFSSAKTAFADKFSKIFLTRLERISGFDSSVVLALALGASEPCFRTVTAESIVVGQRGVSAGGSTMGFADFAGNELDISSHDIVHRTDQADGAIIDQPM